MMCQYYCVLYICSDKKRKAAQVREDSLSPPPLPERPQPQVNVDHQQYGKAEDRGCNMNFIGTNIHNSTSERCLGKLIP